MVRLVAVTISCYMFVVGLVPGNLVSYNRDVLELLQHFQYHRTHENKDIGFLEFLSLHYNNPDHEKSDPLHHQKLPMHHRTASITADQIVFTMQSHVKSLEVTSAPTITFLYKNTFVLTDIPKGIFHPPKV